MASGFFIFFALDLDCSGTTDVADVIILFKVLSGDVQGLGQCSSMNGDMNGDGRLGMEDVLMVLEKLR